MELTNGESYKYQVLRVGARTPYLDDLEDAKFVVRDSYPKIWDILEPELGRQFKLLLRGPPGIGKSVAFSTGHLLYKLRKIMMNGMDLLLPPPSPRCHHHLHVVTFTTLTSPLVTTTCMSSPAPHCHDHLHVTTFTTLTSPLAITT